MVTLNRNKLLSFTGMGCSLLPEFAGKVVYSELNSNNSALLKVPNLNKGLYFLRLTSANKVKIKKIFIE
ncbi:T9SS C-terminal target domain-containing protein [Flavobacterium cupreum]|uniref:T9SS C-terminal target domain-containing protein n=2 Tax=Flavobacterium cupreum TaxID=2133766 RepID=A0A434A0J3_9FLAO|nr:T9SS C-terminal target domain-containing protein [Flavobacterium cupreum]